MTIRITPINIIHNPNRMMDYCRPQVSTHSYSVHYFHNIDQFMMPPIETEISSGKVLFTIDDLDDSDIESEDQQFDKEFESNSLKSETLRTTTITKTTAKNIISPNQRESVKQQDQQTPTLNNNNRPHHYHRYDATHHPSIDVNVDIDGYNDASLNRDDSPIDEYESDIGFYKYQPTRRTVTPHTIRSANIKISHTNNLNLGSIKIANHNHNQTLNNNNQHAESQRAVQNRVLHISHAIQLATRLRARN